MDSLKVKRALLSVSDKENIITIAKALEKNNVEIISTGGTAKKLSEASIKYTPIQKVTGNPESFGGRMKTISFEISSALLFRRDHSNDQKEASALNIAPIDLVICNLYPFEEQVKKEAPLDTLIENIDIGGPNMIRAAAKNFNHVVCLTSPTMYESFIKKLESDTISLEDRKCWAKEAFKMTALYDQEIALELISRFEKSQKLPILLKNKTELRYGENPHQKAWLAPFNNSKTDFSLASAKKLQGKDISYNNLVDADASWKCTSDLHNLFNGEKEVVTIVKHATPCGVAVGSNQLSSLEQAWMCDPTSAFGSIITFNKTVKKEAAHFITERFTEVIIAPDFTDEALEIFSNKKNVRLIKCNPKKLNEAEVCVKSIHGGLLIQNEDEYQNYEFQSVTKNEFISNLKELSSFGMIVNKYLKSNSILLAGNRDDHFVIAGAGMGQPNRIDSLKMLAGPRAMSSKMAFEDLILISDAFFPFPDTIEEANKLGIKAIVQPGGSIKDKDVISRCDDFNIAMALTNIRHFKH